jgi:outer membrane biosynthesis protein TonB
VKFHLKMWSLLSGMTLSLALIGGCNSEEAAPTDKPAETSTTEAAPATPATTPAPSPTETPAVTPAPAETTPAPALETKPAPEEKPKEEAK